MQLRDLDARALEVLACVVEAGGFGPAARRLELTQSAVSHAVARLERRVGARLLVRRSPPEPTRAGQRVIEFARGLAERVAELDGQLRSLVGDGTAGLSVGASPLVTEVHLPALLDRHIRSHPNQGVSVATFGGRELVSKVLAEEVELGFGPFPRRAQGLATRLCFTEQLALHVGQAHAERSALLRGDAHALRRCVLVTSWLDPPEERPAPRRLRHEFADVWEVGDVRLRLRLIASGRVVGYVPRSLVRKLTGGMGLRALTKQRAGIVERPFGLYFVRGRPLSPAGADFLATCERRYGVAAS